MFRNIGNDQMLDFPVIPASDIVSITFIKGKDTEIIFVKLIDKVRIFNDQDKLCFGVL